IGRCARSARTGAFFPTRNRCSSCIIWPWSGLPRSGRCRSSTGARPSTNLPSNLASGCPGWIEPMNPRVTDHSTAGGASRGLAARPLLVLPRCQRAGSHHHNKNQNKTPLTQITLQNPCCSLVHPLSIPCTTLVQPLYMDCFTAVPTFCSHRHFGGATVFQSSPCLSLTAWAGSLFKWHCILL